MHLSWMKDFQIKSFVMEICPRYSNVGWRNLLIFLNFCKRKLILALYFQPFFFARLLSAIVTPLFVFILFEITTIPFIFLGVNHAKIYNNLPMFLVDRERYMHGLRSTDQTYLKLKPVEQSEGGCLKVFKNRENVLSLSLSLFLSILCLSLTSKIDLLEYKNITSRSLA